MLYNDSLINFYLNFYMYVTHYAFYVACILCSCDMWTGFYTNMRIWIWKCHLSDHLFVYPSCAWP